MPRYEPSVWNDRDGVQFRNNCYNYATDIRNNTFAQPGRASGHPYTGFSCREVTPAAVSDGLKTHDCDKACEKGCHMVALVIAPGDDFHWYRQDDDGTWSHKPGRTEATNRDNAGRVIHDPRRADRGAYTEFCGCFCVCHGVRIS